jgi:hypothetical protein
MKKQITREEMAETLANQLKDATEQQVMDFLKLVKESDQDLALQVFARVFEERTKSVDIKNS